MVFRCWYVFWAASLTLSFAEEPACESGVCKAVKTVLPAKDQLMLQVTSDKSHILKSMGEFDTGACRGMPDVERSCSADGCRVLATNMTGKNCNEFCARSQRTCVWAAEEVDETCDVQDNMQCDQIWGTTSDLLCECTSATLQSPAPVPFSDGACTGMPDVERACSTNGCKVLATNMIGKTCDEFCARSGRTCIWAAEEVDETCDVQDNMQCDQIWGTTSDLLCECSVATTHSSPAPQVPAPSGRQLVWADEFNGDALDTSKWDIIEGGGGFGNWEMQFYTGNNFNVQDGKLSIIAKCEWRDNHRFTSAKLETTGKGDWGPGHRVEVRAKIPTGRGTWPAIWMLPTYQTYGGWPKSGEIDIMEAVGCTPNRVYGTVHTQAFNHMLHTEKTNNVGTPVADWHVYSVEWTADRINWYVDEHQFHSFSPGSDESAKWPFDHRFHLILNVAVGGSWGGYCLNGAPSCSDPSELGEPQSMEVDYARVYRL